MILRSRSPKFFFLFLFLISACSDKYRAFKDRYQFKSDNGGPDYSSLDYWAAHPWKWDPSDSIPEPLKNEPRDSIVDVFFIHPTMYTMKKKQSLNAPIDDQYLNAKTDYSTILYQATAFNQHARVFAPRFREAHIRAYFMKDTAKAIEAFRLAYEDVRASFIYYLEHYNQGRPIIIASHSQGTTHALVLLKEFFDGKPLNDQLVAAYIVGMGIPKDHFSSLKLCNDSAQTNCFVGWRTLREGYRPSYMKRDTGKVLVVNPISWSPEPGKHVPKTDNKGSVLYRFNTIFSHTVDATIDDNVLWINKPKFPWSFLYLTRNYHIGDINLFYMNIRYNVDTRIRNYMATRNQ